MNNLPNLSKKDKELNSSSKIKVIAAQQSPSGGLGNSSFKENRLLISVRPVEDPHCVRLPAD
jgi:hypothetical protein